MFVRAIKNDRIEEKLYALEMPDTEQRSLDSFKVSGLPTFNVVFYKTKSTRKSDDRSFATLLRTIDSQIY